MIFNLEQDMKNKNSKTSGQSNKFLMYFTDDDATRIITPMSTRARQIAR